MLGMLEQLRERRGRDEGETRESRERRGRAEGEMRGRDEGESRERQGAVENAQEQVGWVPVSHVSGVLCEC